VEDWRCYNYPMSQAQILSIASEPLNVRGQFLPGLGVAGWTIATVTIITSAATATGQGTASAFTFYFQTTASVLTPDADNIDGSWTNETGGTTLFASIDEPVNPNDSDYIKSSLSPVSDVCKVSLSNPTGPGGLIQQPMAVLYRFGKQGTGGTINLQVRLMQGTTGIATWTHMNVGNALQTVEQVLTGPQFAAITDPTDLYLEFTATSP